MNNFDKLILRCKRVCADEYGMQLYNVDLLFTKYDVNNFVKLNKEKFEKMYDGWITERIWEYIESQRNPNYNPFY